MRVTLAFATAAIFAGTVHAGDLNGTAFIQNLKQQAAMISAGDSRFNPIELYHRVAPSIASRDFASLGQLVSEMSDAEVVQNYLASLGGQHSPEATRFLSAAKEAGIAASDELLADAIREAVRRGELSIEALTR